MKRVDRGKIQILAILSARNTTIKQIHVSRGKHRIGLVKITSKSDRTGNVRCTLLFKTPNKTHNKLHRLKSYNHFYRHE